MILRKPKFWNKRKNFISIILFPLTLIILILNFFREKFITSKEFDIPVICIGNIYLGGTGKTPTSIFIGNELKKFNRRPVILRKFYKAHADEHSLINNYYKDLILCEDRTKGIKDSQANNYDSVILDDGFQDYSIKKDLNIICFNQNQLIGNGMTMPSGPLRESLKSLKKAHIILINGKKDIKFEEKILEINKKIEFFYSSYLPINLSEFKHKKLLAIAGIGNPENFFQILENNKLLVEKKLTFPDHYEFKKEEFENIIKIAKNKNYQVIMTEKDHFKIEKFKFKNIGYLKVSLNIDKKEELISRINKLYDKNI